MGYNVSNQFYKENYSIFKMDHGLHPCLDQKFLVYSSVPGNNTTALLSLPESGSYTVLPSEWIKYFNGVLQNQGYSDYIAYCQIDSEGVQHCVLIYDLQLQDDNIVAAEYPYLYFDGFSLEYGTTSDVTVPGICYASFGQYSDLREGGVNYVSFAILFALVFSFLYRVVSDIFSFIHKRGI